MSLLMRDLVVNPLPSSRSFQKIVAHGICTNELSGSEGVDLEEENIHPVSFLYYQDTRSYVQRVMSYFHRKA